MLFRSFDTPRAYDSHRTTIRLLQGFRGTSGKWDWDLGFLYSAAKSKQNNTGRQSLTLLNEALALSTPDAYNPFCGPNCNDESPFTPLPLINLIKKFSISSSR